MKVAFLAGLLLTVLSVFTAVRPLLSGGYFPMHDDAQVERVVVMGEALQNGQFPVRWVNGLGYGYGYPIFNFYGPLPYYAGGLLYAVGVPAVTATKIMMGLGMLLAAVFMYLVVASYLGPAAATAAGVLYAYAPYHAVQLYVRGAVGELWAYAFFPLLLFALMEIRRAQVRSVWVYALGVAGLSGIILSHTIFGYVTVAAVGIYFAVSGFQLLIGRIPPAVWVRLLLLLIGGLGLTAFFWLPAFAEMRYTRVAGGLWDPVRYWDHFVCISQLWSSQWGYGGSAPGCTDGMSFMLGKLHILLFGLSLTVLWFRKKVALTLTRAFQVSGLIAVTAIFFMLPQSLPVWHIFPFSQYIQYPWRFLSYAALGLSFGGAVWIRLIRSGYLRWAAAGAVILAAVVYNGKWFRPQYIYQPKSDEFQTISDISFRASIISDEYLPPDFVRPASVRDIPALPVEPTPWRNISYAADTETYIRVIVITDRNEVIRINRAYFPGWIYLVNGIRVTPFISRDLPEIELPQGRSVLEARFTDTPVRTLGNILSIIAVTALLLIYGKKTYR